MQVKLNVERDSDNLTAAGLVDITRGPSGNVILEFQNPTRIVWIDAEDLSRVLGILF